MEQKEGDQKTKRLSKKPNGFFDNPTKPKKPDKEKEEDKEKDKEEDKEKEYAVKDILENNNIFITPANHDDFVYLCSNYDINWIEEATTRACNQNNRNLNYVMGILKSWRNKGFVKIDEIKKEFKKKESVEERVRRVLGG